MNLYLESLKLNSGKTFLNVAKELSKIKPIVVLKAGKGEAGRRAVHSHTGSLAGDYRIFSAAFKSAGIVEADDINVLADVSEVLALNKTPKPGSLPVIVTNSGGPAVVLADHVENYNLSVEGLPSNLREEVRKAIPEYASVENLDLLAEADSELYYKVLNILMEDERVGVITTIVNPPPQIDSLEVTKAIIEVWNEHNRTKPLILYYCGFNIEKSITHARKQNVPVTESLRGTALAIKALYDRGVWLEKHTRRNIMY